MDSTRTFLKLISFDSDLTDEIRQNLPENILRKIDWEYAKTPEYSTTGLFLSKSEDLKSHNSKLLLCKTQPLLNLNGGFCETDGLLVGSICSQNEWFTHYTNIENYILERRDGPEYLGETFDLSNQTSLMLQNLLRH